MGALGLGGNQGDAQPAAYLNYILFDKNYKVMDAGWQLTPATTFTKQKISFPTLSVKEAGYLYTWLSYDDDSNNWVYFDDFKVTHTKSNIIQYNEYYPFGLQTANSWTRENATGNNFLANGGTEFNNTSSLYDLDYRNYDPVLGRMNGVDPMAAKFSSVTPYNFSFNNPVTFTDPTGAIPNNWQYTYDDVIYRNYGEWVGNYNDPLGEHITPGSSGDWAMNVLGNQTSYQITVDFNQLADGVYTFGFSNGQLNSFGMISNDVVGTMSESFLRQVVGLDKYEASPERSILYGDPEGSIFFGASYTGREIDWGTVKKNRQLNDFDWNATWGGYFDKIKHVDRIRDWVPILGAVESTAQALERGDDWAAAGNFVLAVSDFALVKSIYTGVARGGLKLLGKSYKYWSSTRSFLGREGFAEAGQQVHHWAWRRNGAFRGEGFAWWAKNQMWNLIPMKSQVFHQSLHGVGPQPFGILKLIWYGTPTWFKAGLISGGGRLID